MIPKKVAIEEINAKNEADEERIEREIDAIIKKGEVSFMHSIGNVRLEVILAIITKYTTGEGDWTVSYTRDRDDGYTLHFG